MSRDLVVKCDGCRKEITRGGDHFIFESDRFTDAAGSGDNNKLRLDFCNSCLRSLRRTLEELLARAKK